MRKTPCDRGGISSRVHSISLSSRVLLGGVRRSGKELDVRSLWVVLARHALVGSFEALAAQQNRRRLLHMFSVDMIVVVCSFFGDSMMTSLTVVKGCMAAAAGCGKLRGGRYVFVRS
jgi:hypothetical protein